MTNVQKPMRRTPYLKKSHGAIGTWRGIGAITNIAIRASGKWNGNKLLSLGIMTKNKILFDMKFGNPIQIQSDPSCIRH